MSNRAVRVIVRLKQGVLDPQGKAVAHGLDALGFAEIDEVRIGKVIDLHVADPDNALSDDAIRRRVREMCEKLLVNPVIEDYEIELPDSN